MNPGAERLVDFDPIEVALAAGGTTETLAELAGPVGSSETTAELTVPQHDGRREAPAHIASARWSD